MSQVALTDLQRMDAEEAYLDVHSVITKVVNRFAERYHEKNVSDLHSKANQLFVDCYFDYDPEEAGPGTHTKFTTKLYQWVWNGLFDQYRVERGHRRHDKRRVVVGAKLPNRGQGPQRPFWLFLDGLTFDARRVAELTVNPPAEISDEAEARGGEVRNFRSVLRGYLRRQGWTVNKINQAFNEIREAL